MKTLQNNLRKYREMAGMSREEIAKILGVSGQVYGQYELGNRHPKIKLICKIADVYHISVDELVGHNPQNSEDKVYNFWMKDKLGKIISDLQILQKGID